MALITENQWIKYFGFKRFPFDRPEAGNDEFARLNFLASCFVEPQGFDRLFGQSDSPVSSLLFAARGTGKTACRVMMDYYCQNGFAKSRQPNFDEISYVLSVPHIKLDNVLAIARQASPNANPPEVLVEYHAIEIMRQAVPAFVRLIGGKENLIGHIKNLPKADIEDFNLLLIAYSTYLTSLQKDFLRSIGIELPSLDRQRMGFLGKLFSHKRLPVWESVPYKQKLTASPLNHLEQWVDLIHGIGIEATYVLVDGVDELPDSAQEPQYAHYLIRPLLTHLRLMDGTPYLAFKFFLPSNMKHIILSDTAFRQDRGFIIQHIEWNNDDLVDILRRRISALINPDDGIRDQTITNFDALCVPELKWAIEHDLAKNANGNPRYLMNLCAQMVTAHCLREIENQDDIYQLNRDDFDIAIERVKALYQRISLAQNFQEGEVLVKRYRVEEIMDTMHSRVIKAWDESLMRFVAIKFPRVNLSKLNEKKIDRIFNNLRREAGILAKLQHPSIGKVYDILEEPFGIVMEWVDGQPIQDFLDREERLSINDIILVGMEVADALAYAHNKGVIHRDIKPKNIILTTQKMPKLIDFDIARDELLDTITSREGGSGILVGTPAYSSPEQLALIDGVPRTEIGPASDIFSLGIVLYEMLSFKKPKVFPNIDSKGIPEPLYRILLGMLDGNPSNRPTAMDLKENLAKLYQTKE